MLRSRIIPCLLIQDKGLVKTIHFKNPKYVGDPLNTVKIFNEKQADEIMVLDITASAHHTDPDYKLIERIANECRMPLCYGGGIKTLEQAKKIFKLGVEKLAFSSAAVENFPLLQEVAERFGNQSIVVVLDIKRKKKPLGAHSYGIYTYNGTKDTGIDLFDFIQKINAAHQSIGELVLNSIDNDGQMQGFDLELIRAAKKRINIPLTCLGGAGSLDDIKKLISEHKIIGAAAGSLFVFKGIYRAVLVNYPNAQEKQFLNQF